MSSNDDRSTIPSPKMPTEECSRFADILGHISALIQPIGTKMLELHAELGNLRRAINEQNEIAGKRIKKLEHRVRVLQQEMRQFSGNGASSP